MKKKKKTLNTKKKKKLRKLYAMTLRFTFAFCCWLVGWQFIVVSLVVTCHLTMSLAFTLRHGLTKISTIANNITYIKKCIIQRVSVTASPSPSPSASASKPITNTVQKNGWHTCRNTRDMGERRWMSKYEKHYYVAKQLSCRNV